MVDQEQQHQNLELGETQMQIACSNCGRIFDLLNNTPYKLPCGHTACKSCLRNCHKDKKEFKCTHDGTKVSLQELRTLQKNIEIIQKLRDKRLDSSSPGQNSGSMFKFRDDSMNVRKDQVDEFFQSNSLQSNQFLVSTPIGEPKELSSLTKFELKQPEDKIVEEEKTPMNEHDTIGQQRRDITAFSHATDLLDQNQDYYPRANDYLAPQGRLEDVVEVDSSKDKTTESMRIISIQNPDASQSLHQLNFTHNDTIQNLEQSKENGERQTHPLKQGTDNYNSQTPQFHDSQGSNIEKPETQRNKKGVQKIQIHDSHHGRQLSIDSQHYENAKEYVEQLIQKSSQLYQSQLEQQEQWTKPLGKKLTEEEPADASPANVSEVGKSKKGKKKGKKKKKKKGNSNASMYVDESYFIEGGVLNDLSEIKSQKSLKSGNSWKSVKSLQKQPSQGIINDLKSIEGPEEHNYELWGYIEDIWLKHDSDQDGNLIFQETTHLYNNIVAKHGAQIGLGQDHHLEWFQLIDQDNDGQISKDEMYDYLQSINYSVKAMAGGYTSEQLQQFLDYIWFRFDSDNDGFLVLGETKLFFEDFIRDRPDLNMEPENHDAWFSMIDIDMDGLISKEEMFNYFQQIGYQGKSIQMDSHVMMKRSPEMADLLSYIQEIWRLYNTGSTGLLTFMDSRALFADLVAQKPELGFSFEKHKEWFEKVDQDCDGAITENEMLEYLLQIIEVQNPFDSKNHGVTNVADLESYVDYLWFKHDSDRDGFLVPSEIKDIFVYFQENRPDIDFRSNDYAEWFSIIDVDNSGLISKHRMIEYLIKMTSPTVEDEQMQNLRSFVDDLVKLYDLDLDGKLSYSETNQIFDDLYLNRESLGLGMISHPSWFKSIDDENTGFIESEQLLQYFHQIQYLNKIQSQRTNEQRNNGIHQFVNQLWDQYDIDKDGFLNIQESEPFFQEIMHNRPDLGFSSSMLQQWFTSIDSDADNLITKPDMLHYFLSINYNGHNDTQKTIEQFVDDLWSKYDLDGDGHLNMQETRPFFENLVMTRTDLGLSYNLYESWFHSLDIDDEGVITKEKMLAYFISINYSGYLNLENLKDYVDYLWAQYDADNDGFLELSECQRFYEEMMKHRPDLQLKKDNIVQWFNQIDNDGEGVITKPKMLHYFISINYSGRQVFNIQDYVEKLFTIYDTDQSGTLNLEKTKPFFNDLVNHRSDLGLEHHMHEQWFKSIDVDDDLSISKNEMLNYFMSINYSGEFNKINLQCYIDFIYAEYDQDKDGLLSKQETNVLFEELIRHRPDLKMTQANHGMWFKRVDIEADGYLSKKEMMEYFTSIQYSGKPVQNILSYVNEIFKEYGREKDGFLTFVETQQFYETLVKQRTDLNMALEGHRAWYLALDNDGDDQISKHEMLTYFISINYSGVYNANNLQAYTEFLWGLYDTDRDGYLILSETKQFFAELIRHRPDLYLCLHHHQEWFASIDANQDGRISKHEMNEYFSLINYSGKPLLTIQNLTEQLWFKYDTDRDGRLSLMETAPFFQDLVKFRTDLKMTIDMHQRWFAAIDTDKDGCIIKQEMLNYLASINYTGTHDRANSNVYVEYLWAQFDTDKDGHLSMEETKPLYDELSQFRTDLKLTPDRFPTWFKSIDSDKDERISKPEMMIYFEQINYSGRALLHIKAYVEEIWQKYDQNRDGYLSLEETFHFYLDLISHRKDLNLSSDRHNQWFHQIDLDQDGLISKLEMFNYFAQLGYSGRQYEIDHITMLQIRLHVDLLWTRYDKDGDGYLQFEETKDLFEGLIKNRKDLGLTPSHHETWFAALDQDRDQRISRFEMFEYFSQLNYHGERENDEELPGFNINNLQRYVDDVWHYYHKDLDALLSYDQSMSIFKDLHTNMPEFDFSHGQEKEWFDSVDIDADGFIHRYEMLAYLNGLITPTDKKHFMHFVKGKAMSKDLSQAATKEHKTDQEEKQPVKQAAELRSRNHLEKSGEAINQNSLTAKSIAERQTPSPQPGDTRQAEQQSYQTLPSNSITKSTARDKDKNNGGGPSQEKFENKMKDVKASSQEILASNLKMAQQSPPVILSQRKNQPKESVRTGSARLGSSKKVQEKAPVMKLTGPAKSVPAEVQQISKSIGRDEQLPKPIPMVALQNPHQGLKQASSSLPEIKSNSAVQNKAKLLAQAQIPQTVHKTPLVIKKPIKQAQNPNSQSQIYGSTVNHLKDFKPKIPSQSQHHPFQQYSKKEEVSEHQLSSKKSEAGTMNYALQLRNNYVMSDKSYVQEDIYQDHLELQDQEVLKDGRNSQLSTINPLPESKYHQQAEKVKRDYQVHHKQNMSSSQSHSDIKLGTYKDAHGQDYQSLDESGVIPKIPVNIQTLSEKCKYHSRETIKYFCRDPGCLKGLCPECIIEHSKHDFIAANELASFEIKQLVKQAQRKCKNHVKIQKEIKAQTEKKLSQLNKMRNEEFLKIHTYFAELKKAIDEREQALNQLFNQEIKDTESNLMKDLHNIQQHYSESTKLFKSLKVFADQQSISTDAGVVAFAEAAYQMSYKAGQKETSSHNLPFYVTSHDASSELPMPTFEIHHCKVDILKLIVHERDKLLQIGQLVPSVTLDDKLQKTLQNHYNSSKGSPQKKSTPIQKDEDIKSYVDHYRVHSNDLSQDYNQSMNLRKNAIDACTQTGDANLQKYSTEGPNSRSISANNLNTFTRRQSGRDIETPAFNEQAVIASSSKNIHWFKWDTNEVFKYDIDTKMWKQKKEIKAQSKFLFFSSIVHLPNEQGCFILGGADNENNYSKRVQYFCKYNVFIEKPPLIHKRAFFPSIFSKLDNSIYAIGGSDSNSSDLNKCEKFSLIENVWRPISPMNLSRNGTAAVIFEQYRLIFAFGGNNHKHGSIHKIEKYEIDFDKWSIIATSMKTAIHDLTVFPVGRERVLILGGHTNIEPNKDIHLLDLSFECFKSRSGKSMIVKDGGKTYFPPSFDPETGKIQLIFGYCDIQPIIEEVDVSELLIRTPLMNEIHNFHDQVPERRSQSLIRETFNTEF